MLELITNIIKVLGSVITAITGVIKIIETIKTINTSHLKTMFFNPLGKVFTASILITALMFLIPWKRIHIDNETPLQKQAVIHDTVRIIHDTVRIGNNNTVTKYRSPYQHKSAIANEKAKMVIIQAEKNRKRTDSLPKNQTVISGGNNSHVINGNGNTVGVNGDQYNGIKPRTFSDADITIILIDIKNMASKHPNWPADFPITIAVPNDGGEAYNYAMQLQKILRAKGFKKIVMGAVGYGGYIKGNYEVTPGLPPEGYPLINIYLAKNIN